MANRETPEVNAGSMADIAFLLLIFFLVTTTMDVDKGMIRKLPEMSDNATPPPPINERNLMPVLINSQNQLLVNNRLMDISELREAAKEFVLNPREDKSLSAKVLKKIDGAGEVMISKGVISLQNDRTTTYEAYMNVQNELVAAYNEIRDDYSMQNFGMHYDVLAKKYPEKATMIRDMYPQRISEAEPKKYGGK